MRTALVIALALSLGLLGTAASGGGGVSAGKATLKLQRTAPLTLRGARFVRAERVVVSVRGNRRQTKRVTANDCGVFVVTFPCVTYDRCDALRAHAVGSRGSRAGLKTPPLLCPPSL
jgi:hypothetical protein